MQHDELIARLRTIEPWAECGELDEAADALQSQAARIAALIAAGDKLAQYEGHHVWCGHGDDMDKPCVCGLTEAQQAWREARDEPA